MRPLPGPRPAAAAIGAGQLLLPVANAQNQPEPPAQVPRAQSPSPGIPDEKLDAEAAAIKSVASIKQNYQRRMAAAEEWQKEGIASQAVDALPRAGTETALSVEEYISILEVAQNDPDVRQKILHRIRPSDQ